MNSYKRLALMLIWLGVEIIVISAEPLKINDSLLNQMI